MRVLFDQGTPVPLREALAEHEVATARERGWSTLTNGELLAIAEREGFEVFVTTDSNLKHQQDLTALQLAIVVLLSTSWPRIQRVIGKVVEAITSTLDEQLERGPVFLPGGAHARIRADST